jgi:hypothetical protein
MMMRYPWIAAVLSVAALTYAAGWFVARLLHWSESNGSFPLMVRAGMGIFLGVAVVVGFVAYRSRRGVVRWERILAEQRLWESGPLGRHWLARRRKASDRDRW